MEQARIDQLMGEVEALAETTGTAAGSWYFDGNSPPEMYERVCQGLIDGDPEILDSIPYPDLSGEWADAPTPKSVKEDIGATDEEWEVLEDELIDFWLLTASDAAIHEVERVAIYQTTEEVNQ